MTRTNLVDEDFSRCRVASISVDVLCKFLAAADGKRQPRILAKGAIDVIDIHALVEVHRELDLFPKSIHAVSRENSHAGDLRHHRPAFKRLAPKSPRGKLLAVATVSGVRVRRAA